MLLATNVMNNSGIRLTCAQRNARLPAFSLIELMVGVSLLALLVVMLSGIFGGVSKTWLAGYSSNERFQNVRAITGVITTELQSALLPVNRTDKAGLQMIVNPSAVSSVYRNPDAFFWQSPASPDLTFGDVAVTGYFVRWDGFRPLLCRLSISNPDPNFLIYSQSGGSVAWLTDAILETAAPANKAGLYKGLIAENVVALFVQCLDAKGRPITRSYAGAAFVGVANGFDSRQGFTDGSGVKTGDYTDATGTKLPLCVLPASVRVSFVLIDPESAARLGLSEKTKLIALASSIASQSPKGDAVDFVTAALNDSALKSISSGLRAFDAEINLLNAR